jgi:hypothetical protein
LSNLWTGVDTLDGEGEGMIFLKKMFDVTKTIAEPNAQRRPAVLDADISNVQASITPMVSGKRERYV